MSRSVPKYFNWVDALRGLAALAVLFSHYHHFYLVDYSRRSEIPDVAEFPYSWLVAPLYEHGGLAVQLFWVISGFVFMHVYLEKETNLRQFAIARFARLYPLHFATLVIVALMQWINLTLYDKWQIYGNNDLRHFGLNLLMSSNWTTLSRGLSFNGPIWSVSLEMGAYGIFFVALPALRRFGLSAAVALFVICYYVSSWNGYDMPGVRQAVFECAYFFFSGTVLYYAFRYGMARPVANPVIIGILILALWIGADHLDQDTSILLAACVSVLMVAHLDVHFGRPGEWLRPLGDISYSIYLVHVPIQIALLTLIDAFAPGHRAMADSLWLLPTFVAVSVVTAHLTYRHFELPAGRFIRSDFRVSDNGTRKSISSEQRTKRT